MKTWAQAETDKGCKDKKCQAMERQPRTVQLQKMDLLSRRDPELVKQRNVWRYSIKEI